MPELIGFMLAQGWSVLPPPVSLPRKHDQPCFFQWSDQSNYAFLVFKRRPFQKPHSRGPGSSCLFVRRAVFPCLPPQLNIEPRERLAKLKKQLWLHIVFSYAELFRRTDRLSLMAGAKSEHEQFVGACLKSLLVHHSGSDCLGSSSHCPTKMSRRSTLWNDLCPESTDAFVAAVLFKNLEIMPQSELNS